jgi:HK97 family phage prohead protease
MADTPPRENIYRAAYVPGAVAFESRSSDNGSSSRMLTGHFAVFNRWTEIDSMYEGHFLERIAPGTFKKTFQAPYSDGIRALFQHGHDPQIGDKPLGTVESLSEDEIGAAYEVSLFDTSYNRDLIPGLSAGVYGASFRFRVTRDDFNREPEISEYNPTGIPERTIREAAVSEFGPVTFPAYAEATAGLRSITDEMVIGRFIEREPEKMREILARMVPTIPPVEDAGQLLTSETRRAPGIRPLTVIRNPNREAE